ncbi:hypothetical protein VTO73DRAFT_14587 [Trametes versicolor]
MSPGARIRSPPVVESCWDHEESPAQPDPLHLQYPITGPQFDRERKEAHWLKLSGFPCTCIYTRSRVAQSR